ncbi:MAG: ribonuclease HI [bacterium]
MKNFDIYVDGACSGNPGPGGYGIVIINEYFDEKSFNGFEPNTTNNRMELMAAIVALEKFKKFKGKNIKLEVYSDSNYVVQGMNSWIKNWKRKNWKNVKNVDLWKRLDAASNGFRVIFNKVSGHSGNTYNEKADKLAKKAIKQNI